MNNFCHFSYNEYSIYQTGLLLDLVRNIGLWYDVTGSPYKMIWMRIASRE